MAIMSNKVDVTDLVTAIQEYAAACVKESKLPRYAESRRIDAIRATRYARVNYMLEIDKLTEVLVNTRAQMIPNHDFHQDPTYPGVVGQCDYTYGNGDRCGMTREQHMHVLEVT